MPSTPAFFLLLKASGHPLKNYETEWQAHGWNLAQRTLVGWYRTRKQAACGPSGIRLLGACPPGIECSILLGWQEILGFPSTLQIGRSRAVASGAEAMVVLASSFSQILSLGPFTTSQCCGTFTLGRPGVLSLSVLQALFSVLNSQ